MEAAQTLRLQNETTNIEDPMQLCHKILFSINSIFNIFFSIDCPRFLINTTLFTPPNASPKVHRLLASFFSVGETEPLRRHIVCVKFHGQEIAKLGSEIMTAYLLSLHLGNFTILHSFTPYITEVVNQSLFIYAPIGQIPYFCLHFFFKENSFPCHTFLQAPNLQNVKVYFQCFLLHEVLDYYPSQRQSFHGLYLKNPVPLLG